MFTKNEAIIIRLFLSLFLLFCYDMLQSTYYCYKTLAAGYFEFCTHVEAAPTCCRLYAPINVARERAAEPPLLRARRERRFLRAYRHAQRFIPLSRQRHGRRRGALICREFHRAIFIERVRHYAAARPRSPAPCYALFLPDVRVDYNHARNAEVAQIPEMTCRSPIHQKNQNRVRQAYPDEDRRR